MQRNTDGVFFAKNCPHILMRLCFLAGHRCTWARPQDLIAKGLKGLRV